MIGYDELKTELNKRLPSKKQTGGYNQYHMSPKRYALTQEAVDLWNDVIDILHQTELNYPIIRTASGAIAKGPKKTLWNCCAWDVQRNSRGARLTIILGPDTYVLTLGKVATAGEDIYPDQAFNAFRSKCEEFGIDLDEYEISNGEEVKAEIPSPPIAMFQLHSEEDPGIENVHHLDFHNSYPAGLANTHPEFRPVVEYFYEQRKVDPINKAVLNYTIGQMQSLKKDFGAKFAHLAKDALTDSHERVKDVAVALTLAGRRVIGYNTDGVWYQGEIYHGPGEGPMLGQWENDHTTCIFRAKSRGCYEFIENGEYHAVARGTLPLDAVKPDRATWKWGDIYCGEQVRYALDDDNKFYTIIGDSEE